MLRDGVVFSGFYWRMCYFSSHSKLINHHSRGKQQLRHEPLKIPLIGICSMVFCIRWNLQWVCEIFQLLIMYRAEP